jgi:hypothetical protein
MADNTNPQENLKVSDRRHGPASPLVTLVVTLREDLQLLDTRLFSALKQQKDDMETLMNQAFPEGDADGHRRHHEAVIKAAEDRAKFWNTMSTELAKWGLIGFVAWIAVHMWQAFLQGPSK